MRKRIKQMLLLFLLLILISCNNQQSQPQGRELLNAVLWMQQSAEYKALGLQAYHNAQRMLNLALQDENWTAALEQRDGYRHLPPAVILDVDETILNNSAYEARLIKNGQSFSSPSWKKWCRQARATAVSGAVHFCQYAAKKKITVFYVTNRKEKFKEATRKNLKAQGFPFTSGTETLIMRTTTSDKGPRRKKIAAHYRILLLIGDSGGDFASGFTHSAQVRRDSLLTTFADYWGIRWIILPNPSYGDWEGALFNYNYRLPYAQKIARKMKKLKE